VILTVQAQAPISIRGCLGDYTWCDVVFGYDRGWMRSTYLSGIYQGYYYPLRDYAPRLGYSVVNFDINQYWDLYYRDRTFYQDRSQCRSSTRRLGAGQCRSAMAPLHVRPLGLHRSLRMEVELRQAVWLGHLPLRPMGFLKPGWLVLGAPGSRWGPAWVSWRSSDNYLAWAPLPPSYDEDVSINIRVETVPDYYWQVVPTGAFVSTDLSRYIVRDESRYEPILQKTRPLGNVTINNNVVVNNVVNVNGQTRGK